MKKLVSILLALVMLLSLVPVALAEGDAAGVETPETPAAEVKAETETEVSAPALGAGTETAKVAKIGDTEYETLAAAVEEATDGATIMLLKDVTEDVTIPAGKTITLDLSDKMLSNTNNSKATLSVEGTAVVKNGTISGGTGYYNIEVKTGGSLTLENVTATAGNNGSSMIDNWGMLTITSGTYTGGLNVVKSEEGSTLNICGGKFTLNYSTSGYTGVILNYGTAIITDGEFIQNATSGRWNHPQVVATGMVEGYTAITKIAGGTFINNKSDESIFHGIGKATSDNFEVSGGNFNKSVTSGYLKDGLVCKKDSETNTYKLVTGATGVTLSESEKTIKVGESFKLEATLTPEDAELKSVEWKTSAKKVATVTNGVVKGVAIGDVTITATPNAAGATPATCIVHVYDEVAQIGATKYPTIEAALAAAQENDTITLLKNVSSKTTVEISKSVTLDLGGFTVTGPKVEVKSGQSKWYEYIALKVTDGTVTIKNGTVSGRVNVYDAANVTIEKDVTINNKCFNSSTSGYGIVVWGDGTYGQAGCKTPILNIYGKVNVTGNNGVAISTNGTDKSKPIINIYDGAEITSEKCSGIYLPSGALTVSGGTITGATGIYFKSTDMTISGGTIIGNGAKAEYKYNGNGANTTGDALVIDNCNYPNGIGTVKLSGGNFKSVNAAAVGSYAGNGQTEPLVGFITGGLFSSDPSAYVAADHYVDASNNGAYPYTVKKGTKPAGALIVVKDKTDTAVSGTIKDEDKTAINNVIGNANIDGVAEAVNPNKKGDIVAKSGVTLTGTEKVEIEVAVKVEAKAADLANGKLTFEAAPVATVKVNGTEASTKVPVTNDMLNGQSIAVKLPLPAGFSPEQIKHISSDGSVEYFLKTAKRGAKTFTIEDGCAVFTISKFSTFELSGTVTYVAPSSGGGSGSGSGSVGSGAHTVTSDLTGTITKVTVDGKTVASKHYTISGGNVTFTEAFMKTLSNGTHKVTIETATKIARGTFTVDNGTKPVVSSKTGDAGIALYAGMAIASVMGGGLVLTSRKRRSH